MGTPKQAAAAVTILSTIRRQQGEPPMTLAEQEAARSRVLTATNEEIREAFRHWNSITGFDRHTSDATPQQRRVIERLERVVYGGRRTTYRTALTYSDASALIEELQEQRNALRVPA